VRQRILITGATGFLGRHLQEQWTERGRADVVALVRDPDAWHQYEWTDDVVTDEIVEGALADVPDRIEDDAFGDLDVIYHLAGVVRHSRARPEQQFRVNVDGTLEMVRLAAHANARLVFVSTSGTVGCFPRSDMWADEQAPYCEETVANWPYYVSKIEAERQARQLADRRDVELVVVRPPMLWGPRDHRHRSTGLLRTLLQENLPAVPNGKVDFADVRDVASLLVTLAQVSRPRPVYHAPGTACRTATLLDMIEAISDVDPPRTDVPTPLLWSLCEANRRWGDTLPLLPDAPDPVYIEMAAHFWESRSVYAHNELDYEARSPRQTLVDTFHWLRTVCPELDPPWSDADALQATLPIHP
jgi:nucleoside-diphosphate-sugar epimerase